VYDVKWTNSALKHLESKFGKEPFSTKEAVTTLEKKSNYSRNAVKQVLHELVNKGFLIRIGRGIYKVPEKPVVLTEAATLLSKLTVELTSGYLIRAETILKEKGIDFMVTGPSALAKYHHHLPRRLIHLIYVTVGAGEFASTALREGKLCAFLNPKRGEVEIALQALEERDIFVIREHTKLEGNVGGRATLEKAIVDAYFETTRHRITFSELEVGRIIANAFRTGGIDIATLLGLAGRRGIRGEFKSIIKELIPNVPLTDEVTNKHVKKVLEGIRA
jgi:biotin operon repressor